MFFCENYFDSQRLEEGRMDEILRLREFLTFLKFSAEFSGSEAEKQRQIHETELRLLGLEEGFSREAILNHKEKREAEDRQKKEKEIEFNKKYNETAKEAIFHGLSELSRTLERIWKDRGNLPKTLIFCDTATRPLRYAILPLLKKIYGTHQQPLPLEIFIKTFSSLGDEESKRSSEDERLAVFDDRLREVISYGQTPFLVVDDMVSQRARTFSGIYDSFERIGLERKNLYFFAFLVHGGFVFNKPTFREHLSAGVVYRAKDDSIQSGLRLTRMAPADLSEWKTLYNRGFPFRLEVEKTIGVIKDQTSTNPYVELSDKADPVAKRIEREKYAAWGKEAVEKIFAEKGTVVVKS